MSEAAELTFTVVYVAEGDGVTAYVEELPMASAYGRTIEEAERELRKVVDIVISANRRQTWEGFRHGRVLSRKVVTIDCPD